jgi:hypothetical protein
MIEVWNKKLGVAGVFHIFLMLITFILVSTGFGIWGVMKQWRILVQTQIRLDRCVGDTALELRNHLNSLVSINQRIFFLRQAIGLAKLEPWLIPPLEAELYIVVGKQEWMRNSWKIRELKWIAVQGCSFEKEKNLAVPLPDLPFARDLPDDKGPQALRWSRGTSLIRGVSKMSKMSGEDKKGKFIGRPDRTFCIQLRSRSRNAAAKVEGGSDGSFLNKKKWEAFWDVPKI